MSDSLKIIGQEVMECTKCDLCKTRTHAVPGEGDERAKVLFIGEGPGRDEDMQGRPFIGRSGKFLREMIRLVGLKEEDVFITNVVKCRPPENRDPKAEEIIACHGYLDRQVALIQPRVIATLGRHSMGRFLENAVISKVHGRVFERADGVCLFPLYHPAVALYSPAQKEILLRDMRRLPILLDYLKDKKITVPDLKLVSDGIDVEIATGGGKYTNKETFLDLSDSVDQ